MKNLNLKTLAAKICLILTLGTGGMGTLNKPAEAGIPVIDVASLVQSVLTAIESISQTLQMIQSYQAMLMQLENQIQNTLNPDLFLWDQANVIMGDLMGQIDTIRSYKNQFGSVDSYITKFKDLKSYRDAPCFSSGCTPEDLIIFEAEIKQQQSLNSEAIKKSNDAMIKALDKQQDQIESDADRLRDLQLNAQSAQGQVEAIQHANQLASSQANQLLQIRALMVSQQSAMAAVTQAATDDDALKRAASEKATESRFEPTLDRSISIR